MLGEGHWEGKGSEGGYPNASPQSVSTLAAATASTHTRPSQFEKTCLGDQRGQAHSGAGLKTLKTILD